MKNSKNKPGNGATEPKQKRHKSRVAAGLRLLPGMTYNGTGAWGRIVRDVRAAIYAHCGGEQHITETLRLQARRVGVLEAELVFLEQKFATAHVEGREPETSDLEIYGRLAAHQRRACEPLGWQRTPRTINTPTLSEYIARRPRRRPDDDVEDVEDLEEVEA